MNPLRCDDVKNLLVEYLEFELPLTEREKFHEHLARCAQCRVAHDELQQVLEDVKAIDVVYPPQSYWDELSGNVLNEVKNLRAAMAGAIDNEISESKSGINDNAESVDPGSNNNVIVFSKVRSRKTGESVKLPEFHHEMEIQQVAPVKSRPPASRYWPKVAFPIAAAVLMGIAATFTFLERETLIFNDDVRDKIGFQAQIQSDYSLAELARKVAPLSQPGNQLGFAAHKVLFNEFSIASLFSEAKVYALEEQEVELKTYLALLKTALQNEATPLQDIINSISLLQSGLDAQPDFAYVNMQLTRLLNEYVTTLQVQDDQRYYLARAGAWLFDYALAVLAQDEMSVRQLAQLVELTENLQIAGVPPGVIKSFNRIQDLINRPVISKREYQILLEEVENIRSLLG
jgi:hypothetical protein